MNTSPLIVIIDDNEIDRFIVQRLIHTINPNHIPVTFESGETALDYFKRNASSIQGPGAILLDISMPGMNGWEFLREYDSLVQQHPNLLGLRLYFLTSSNNQSDYARASQNALVNGFLIKPATAERIRAVLAFENVDMDTNELRVSHRSTHYM